MSLSVTLSIIIDQTEGIVIAYSLNQAYGQYATTRFGKPIFLDFWEKTLH